jgi:hypothetical protein
VNDPVLGRTDRMVTRRQRHSDHCRPAKHHVDADQQAERPGRRSRQAGKDNSRQNEVDEYLVSTLI